MTPDNLPSCSRPIQIVWRLCTHNFWEASWQFGLKYPGANGGKYTQRSIVQIFFHQISGIRPISKSNGTLFFSINYFSISTALPPHLDTTSHMEHTDLMIFHKFLQHLPILGALFVALLDRNFLPISKMSTFLVATGTQRQFALASWAI